MCITKLYPAEVRSQMEQRKSGNAAMKIDFFNQNYEKDSDTVEFLPLKKGSSASRLQRRKRDRENLAGLTVPLVGELSSSLHTSISSISSNGSVTSFSFCHDEDCNDGKGYEHAFFADRVSRVLHETPMAVDIVPSQPGRPKSNSVHISKSVDRWLLLSQDSRRPSGRRSFELQHTGKPVYTRDQSGSDNSTTADTSPVMPSRCHSSLLIMNK